MFTENWQECLDDFTNNVFNPTETLFYISDENHYDILWSNVHNPHLIAFNEDLINGSVNYYNYVIISKNKSMQQMIEELVQTRSWDISRSPRGRFLGVILNEQSLGATFKAFWNVGATNVILLVNNEKRPLLYTSNPFTKDNLCLNESRVISQHSCKDGIDFYKILPTLEGCKIGINRYRPSYINDTSAEYYLTYDTIEIIIKIIAKLLETEAILEDESLNIQLLINPMFLHHLFRTNEISLTFFHDRMVWIAPRMPKEFSFQLILSAFEASIWRLIALVFIIILLIWWMAAIYIKDRLIFRDFSRCFLTVFIFTFGGGTNILPKTKVLKLISFMYLFYIINILNALQANLISILTNPKYEDSVTTVEGFANLDLPIVASLFGKKEILKKGNVSIFQNIYKRLVIEDPFNKTQTLHTIFKYRNCSSYIGLNYLLKFYSPQKELVNIIKLSGLPFMDSHVCMQKGHYFYDTFNMLSRRLIEGGFFNKYVNDVVFTFRRMFINDDHFNVVLTMEHLYGLFLWWLIGLGIASSMFLIELFYWHFTQNRVK